jgi:hypothetical protein
MALNFKKNSFSAEQLINLRTKGNVDGEKPTFNKSAWYKMPEGLELFDTPKQEVFMKFDVLDFTLTAKMHSDLAKQGAWDVVGQSYWYYPVSVHECFPKAVVCNRTFSLKKADNDVVCRYLWDNQDIDFRRIRKTYSILLLRLHPNADLGITDYKYVLHIDTNGKLQKAIMTAWDKAIARKDLNKINFSKWDESGMSVEAFFHQIPNKVGNPYWGCDDITFIKREVPIPDADKAFLDSLDICAGIVQETPESYTEFIEHLKVKAPRMDGSVPSQAGAPAPAPQPVAEAPKPSVKPKAEPIEDPAFANPVPIEEEPAPVQEKASEVETEDWI